MQVDRQTELAIVRRAYAKQIMAAARVVNPRIQDAYAQVPREDFLGPGPWPIMRMLGGYATTPEADPVYLYADYVVGIVPERWLNNGQPSFHAALLASVDINEGDHVVHVGTGTGYYTAIMAVLAGATGKVTAIEFDVDLAERAKANLATRSNVTVLQGDGATTSFDAAHVIYVNAGVTRPMPAWLDGLEDGGRLILPLTTNYNFRAAKPGGYDPARMLKSGAYFRIQRRGAEFDARGIMATAIIPAESARDPESEAALEAAFEKGGWDRVRHLVRGTSVPEETCWLRGDGWCLTYE
jgi:protein-L-isoaspartate(D-aspartate) O-methyltransferase